MFFKWLKLLFKLITRNLYKNYLNFVINTANAWSFPSASSKNFVITSNNILSKKCDYCSDLIGKVAISDFVPYNYFSSPKKSEQWMSSLYKMRAVQKNEPDQLRNVTDFFLEKYLSSYCSISINKLLISYLLWKIYAWEFML